MSQLAALSAVSVVRVWLLCLSVMASGLDGLWQHESGAIWLKMDSDHEEGVLMRSDNSPGRVGLKVVSHLLYSGKPNEWRGKVFVTRFEEY